MRQFIIFLTALIALSGSLSAVFASQAALDYDLRGYVDPTEDMNLPYRLPTLGVNADLFQYDEATLRQNLVWMQQAHITWVRQFLYWNRIEISEDQRNWQQWDNLLRIMQDYPDLQFVVVVMNSPGWARQSEIASAPPDNPEFISPFLRDFASRYGEAIDYYQIWDEPNLDDAWGLSEPRPADYLALLSEAYTAIHGADEDATVIAAALAPTKERSGMNIADTLYLDALYDLGGAAYFDAAATKPYGFGTSPDDRTVNIDTLNFSRIIALREVMLEHGDGQTALWASNWGWNHLPEDWQGDPSIWGAVSEEERISYSLTALHRAEREWPWLGGMILHHWQPVAEVNDPQWGFSLIGQDGQPNSLWQALVNRPQIDAAANGLYHPRTPYAQYSGLWTFSELGADIGWLLTSDSQAQFRFYGRDIALMLREGDYFAFLYPRVDGENANATAHDANGNSYILLRSASLEEEITLNPVSRNLSLDTHLLQLIPDRGWDRWALAGYAVSDGNLAEPYRNQIAVAWLTVFASATATLVSSYFLPWEKIRSKVNSLLNHLNTASQVMISVITSIALMLGMMLTWGTGETHLFRREMAEQTALIVITGGLLVLELPFVLLIISALVLFVLIYRHLETGLFLIILYTPFFLFPVELYKFAFPMSELLLLITAAAWILRLFAAWGRERQSANRDYPLKLNFRWQSFDVLMFFFGLLGLLAIFVSARQDPAVTEFRTFFFEPILFYAMLRGTKPSLKQLRHYIYALLIAGSLVSVIGIIQYLRGEAIITAEEGARRLASVYGSPNNVGLFLGRCIPFVLAFILLLKPFKLRLMMAATLLLMLVTVALTQSVGAILIGIPVGIASVILLTYHKKAIFPVALLMILAIGAAFVLAQSSARFASLLDISTGTSFMRIRVWESSLEILQRSPITGLGLDQFLYEFRGTFVRPDAIFDPDLSHPHNLFLDFWIRLGLLGLVWIVFCLGFFWRKGFTLWQKFQDERRILLIGLMGAMAALIAHGFIDNSVFVQDLVYIFVFMLALLANLAD